MAPPVCSEALIDVTVDPAVTDTGSAEDADAWLSYHWSRKFPVFPQP